MRSKLKWGDFVIIGVVLALAAVIAAVLALGVSGDRLYAEVWQDNTLVERVELTDSTDGDHEATPSTTTTLIDTVTYTGLVPGRAD